MIDVLTLVKNREAHLDNLVQGLRRSSLPPSQLVIVDMSERPVATPSCDWPVTVVRHPSAGLPLAEARNLAASVAQADHLLFLDVDCIPSSDLIAAMAGALSRHDALICAEVLYLPADAAKPSGWTEEMLLAKGQPHPVRVFPEQGLKREENAGLFWSLAFGISRSTFNRLGGFDKRFTGYGGEDTDFGFTARAAGIELMFMGGPKAFHQHHGVVDPPLHHLADIVSNAKLFFDKWNVWPMEGWLKQFAALGYITWEEREIAIVREPRDMEIDLMRSASRAF